MNGKHIKTDSEKEAKESIEKIDEELEKTKDELSS